MYFEIENTPEHLRRARKKEIVRNVSPKEECPRLVLAPFSRPPQVIFDNVLVGTSCERTLEVLNPLKQAQQITLGKALPPGLQIHLPGEWLFVEPETCYCLTMVWTPMQPTALRETLRFTNESRGRYDVILVLKAVLTLKGKNTQSKFKVSPGKVKKVSKRSPVAILKKKAEVILKETTVKKSVNVIKSTQYEFYDKENISTYDDQSMNSNFKKCPFDSSIDFNFDTSEVFPNTNRRRNDNLLHDMYEKPYSEIDKYNVPQNVLKPSNNKIYVPPAADIFDNLSFTPLKSHPNKSDKLDKGPKIILSMNSESDFDDSLDKNSNKENETHSIICITSAQNTNQWLTTNNQWKQINNNHTETPVLQNKKVPNTSSPKELNSPNFTINTEFSRISDLSFLPQRFSTERKVFPKLNNETHDIIDDTKLNSDTYTKESPITPFDYQVNQMHAEPKHGFHLKEQPKLCRQALFKENLQQKEFSDKNYLFKPDTNMWNNDVRVLTSPPRSITPPLQSIPEESTQFGDTQTLNNTDNQMTTFTINRTFDKTTDRPSLSTNRLSSWSKKAIRVETDLWKIPAPVTKKETKKKNLNKSKVSTGGKKLHDASYGQEQNVSSYNIIGNIYSQSFTVDPFSSSTYFYDEGAVEKFENEFKRWLNYVLTPPADLDSNVEIKIDVGKAWIENRNKEVPAAPTKEQVCSNYHNSHRLKSLRRAARTLLMSPEISQVLLKLNIQIEKKLIAIRNDRNLHLDVGLQKVIMEVLLSYNPLWLRIGLEAIYGVVIPLKTNSDVEGLTTFIIHRMFKNPLLKNKHSKSSAPNMLLPAYMEAIKKFTLKKFFTLVFFLDQAKQKKLIPHDPCLFCRNAICKESREIIIRFTRELIAGIGDITKHLRPLGYVVTHKQSYLDEYKYAVHNIALDIRDGVRLTKVMEIILMKNGLLNQLRTPAISRLQKIHNVQVAFNALREADFVIDGDITASDIADGHREKTLSLLWQLIHVFRAPLFQKAANIIQTWWRKKYAVIVKEREEQERIRIMTNNAASIIQYWWKRIQYKRMHAQKMYRVTVATITIQKYCRMWLCRSHLRRLKTAAVKIAVWYKSMKIIREARETLLALKISREKLRQKSAVVIQSQVRQWLCRKQFQNILKKIILIQSILRCFLVQKRLYKLENAVRCIQEKYRGKLLMRVEMKRIAKIKQSIVRIQSYFRMWKQRKYFNNLKATVNLIENRYKAIIEMRKCRSNYLTLKKHTIQMQSLYRRNKVQREYNKLRNVTVKIQRRIRANKQMMINRERFLQLRNAAIIIQKYVKSYAIMKPIHTEYISKRKATVVIQRYYRSYLLMKTQRNYFIQLKTTTVRIQSLYRGKLAMQRDRAVYISLKNATVVLQRRYRAQMLMRESKSRYQSIRTAIIILQKRFRAFIKMREERKRYEALRSSCYVIQNQFRAYLDGKKQRQIYLRQKQAAITIQTWFRSIHKTKEIKKQFEQSRQACIVIQRVYRAYVVGNLQRREYLKVKTATICIQKHFRNYLITKRIRQEYIRIRTSTITIQRFYRTWKETKVIRYKFLITKKAAKCIQNYYRRYRETNKIQLEYNRLRTATIYIQTKYRNLHVMRNVRAEYLKLRQTVIAIQSRYRALLAMKTERQKYLKLRSATITLQNRFRAKLLMMQYRKDYLRILKAAVTLQTYYRAYKLSSIQRKEYLKLKNAALVIQNRYRSLLLMRSTKEEYLKLRCGTLTIQRRFRAQKLMKYYRNAFIEKTMACIKIQRYFRAYMLAKTERHRFLNMKAAVILIQSRYREFLMTRKLYTEFIKLRCTVISIQRHIRTRNAERELVRKNAANKIQIWYISVKKRNECRSVFVNIRRKIIILQSFFRMIILRNRFIQTRNAATTIQKHYRCYKLAKIESEKYLQARNGIIRLQSLVRTLISRKRYLRLKAAVVTIKTAYLLKKRRDLLKKQREEAAVCIQKYVRRYLIQSWFVKYRQHLITIQRIWRGKLVTRLMRCDFLQKKLFVIKLQAAIRGYLIRKQIEIKRQNLLKVKEEKRRNWAAAKIQALFRGHLARSRSGRAARELRRRWRDGGLRSTQDSLKDRNEDALDVLRNMSDIETVIRAFKSLELLTEVFPMMYNTNASSVVRRVYIYMSLTNRSISSIDVLKSAASILVNLARYRITGPKIYARDRILPVLKFMWRFSNSEVQLFCILSTYLWLFSKYEHIKMDLTELLQTSENHKMLITIRNNVKRMKRMANNNTKNKFSTPNPKNVSHSSNLSFKDNMNLSLCSNSSNNSCGPLPAIEPDYGIVRPDRPRYFEDAEHAINCLFLTYKL